MKRILLAVLALAGCEREAAPAVVAVSAASCRPTVVERPLTACYVTLTASRDDRLVAVSSAAAASVELHRTEIDARGVARMTPQSDGLALPAGEAVALRPGAEHLMVTGLRQPLAEGGAVPLTLAFRNAPPVTVSARVGQPALATGAHAHH